VATSTSRKLNLTSQHPNFQRSWEVTVSKVQLPSNFHSTSIITILGGEMKDCDDMNIMNNSDDEEEENADYEESQLYYPSGIKNKEMWQCIRFITPCNEKKKWKNEDRIAVYCTKCQLKIKYDAKKCKWNNKAHEKQAREFDK
jgi:hypothetical protein